MLILSHTIGCAIQYQPAASAFASGETEQTSFTLSWRMSAAGATAGVRVPRTGSSRRRKGPVTRQLVLLRSAASCAVVASSS
ncbi:hypothetical protein ACLF3G_24945 [Falsiroseomonas sp. HC035]|uniref:hypothetical protein n=1 Tax=Falsiroseomonas sp. HC035 TaxID=3390999 RepID=UPI003D31C783